MDDMNCRAGHGLLLEIDDNAGYGEIGRGEPELAHVLASVVEIGGMDGDATGAVAGGRRHDLVLLSRGERRDFELAIHVGHELLYSAKQPISTRCFERDKNPGACQRLLLLVQHGAREGHARLQSEVEMTRLLVDLHDRRQICRVTSLATRAVLLSLSFTGSGVQYTVNSPSACVMVSKAPVEVAAILTPANGLPASSRTVPVALGVTWRTNSTRWSRLPRERPASTTHLQNVPRLEGLGHFVFARWNANPGESVLIVGAAAEDSAPCLPRTPTMACATGFPSAFVTSRLYDAAPGQLQLDATLGFVCLETHRHGLHHPFRLLPFGCRQLHGPVAGRKTAHVECPILSGSDRIGRQEPGLPLLGSRYQRTPPTGLPLAFSRTTPSILASRGKVSLIPVWPGENWHFFAPEAICAMLKGEAESLNKVCVNVLSATRPGFGHEEFEGCLGGHVCKAEMTVAVGFGIEQAGYGEDTAVLCLSHHGKGNTDFGFGDRLPLLVNNIAGQILRLAQHDVGLSTCLHAPRAHPSARPSLRATRKRAW